MIPIRDVNPSHKVHWIRNILVLVNAAMFFYMLLLTPSELKSFVEKFGFLEHRFAESPLKNSYTLVSYQFVHGGLGHILGNMWYLWVFGDNVEARFGSFKFLLFYIFSGLFSCMVQTIAFPHFSLPLIGASGSIAGVLGAYAALFPRAKIITWIPIGFFGWTAQIRAMFFLGIWFLYQFVLGSFTYNPYAAAGGIAWWAHIGGFVFGLLFGLNMRKR